MDGFPWSTVGWIAGLIFVYVFGLFEGRGQGYKKRKAEEVEAKKDIPEPKPVVNTVKVDDPGLLRIKNENGFLTLDLDGLRVDTNALSSEQRKRLIEMLTLVRPWLEGKPVHVPTPATPAPPPVAQPQPVIENRPSVPLQSPPPPAAAPRNTSPRPTTMAKEDRPSAPAGSIVNQIDSVLQQRIVGTPLEERGIFLTQSPEGGVIVYVGLTKYMGIDDVPDPEVKAAIRAAITEWENKYTPGL
jgi:hypothetical protein